MAVALQDERYRRRMLALLVPAAFFNGFDGELRALLLPQLRATFHVSVASVGIANIPIAAGQFVALLIIRRADRIGRRPLLISSLFGYALFSALTASSWDLAAFATFQTLSQVFLGTQFALAVTVVAEELPSEERGRAIGYLLVASPLGVVATAGLLGAGLLQTPLGWRSFYLVGAVPVVLVAVARRALRETRAFEQIAAAPAAHPLREAFSEPHRRRIASLGVLSLLDKIPVAGAAGWWVYYAEHVRHLSTHLVALDLGAAFALGTAGYLVCGWAIDHLGRKPVALVYLLCAFAAALELFHARTEGTNFVYLVLAVFFGLGIGPALSALSAESFPTEIRAGASAIVGNGFAATGELLGPALVGILGTKGGLIGSVGGAVSALAFLLLGAAAVLVLLVPETRGTVLVVAPGRRVAPRSSSRDEP